MKKLISIIAATSLVASLSLTSFAAVTTSVTKNDETQKGFAEVTKNDDGSFKVDFKKGDAQKTIVVVKGGESATIDTNSIEYINQISNSSSGSTSQNVNFVMRNTISAGNTYTVYVGGTNTEKKNVATITAANTWTIKFMDGTTVLNETTTYADGATVTAPTPTKDGSTFKGWALSENGEIVTPDSTATKDVTYYAVWQENSTTPADKFTVKGSVSNYASDEFFASDDVVEALEDVFENDQDAYDAELARIKSTYAINAYLFNKTDLESFANYYIGESDEMPTPIVSTTVNSANGEFVFNEVENGNYLLIVWRDGALPYMDYVTVNGADINNTTAIELLYGEVKGTRNGIIDYNDAFDILANGKYLAEDPDYDGSYDINFDSVIDYNDAFDSLARSGALIYDYNTEATSDLEDLDLI